MKQSFIDKTETDKPFQNSLVLSSHSHNLSNIIPNLIFFFKLKTEMIPSLTMFKHASTN